MQPPPAPLLKDLDSFTEGTARGSFDFSLRSQSSTEQLIGSAPQPEPLPPVSVAFSLDDPCRSIEVWRDDVLTSTQPNPTIGGADGSPETPRGAGSTPSAPHMELRETRALKRHLSATSVDVDYERGRRLTRHRVDTSMGRLWNVSPMGSLYGSVHESPVQEVGGTSSRCAFMEVENFTEAPVRPSSAPP